MRNAIIAASVAVALGACGGSGAFQLTSDDNNPERLQAAFARMQKVAPGPVNETGRPMVFLVARGKPKKLVAFDLEQKKELWRVATDIESKVAVGSRFVAHLEGKGTLVGRDLASGKALWSVNVGDGKFIGAAADGDRLYYTAGGKGKWALTAVEGRSGDELWRADSPGALGAPAASGGLVFSPFLKQWLAILDGTTGDQLARIRGIDEEITFVTAKGGDVFFGSKAGVFLLDERAASGKRAQSTYGTAALPDEFVRVHYGLDAFDPVQAGYSAYDRNRILWRGSPGEGGQLAFAGDRVVVHTYRFLFGFGAKGGQLAWAYSHPRVDVISSAHLGGAIGFASMGGEIGAIDPATGQRLYSAEVPGQFIGATFDAEGWQPAEAGPPAEGTAAVLAKIANDRDARFEQVKKFAVSALATLDGGDVIEDLIALIQGERTPPALYEASVEALVTRRDPAGLPALVAALQVRYDHVSGTRPRAVGALARAVAALPTDAIGKGERAKAVTALEAQLFAPQTTPVDLEHVVRALAAVGDGAERSALRSFVLMYRADPDFSAQVGAVGAAIDALVRTGRPADRELVAFVADDARSQSAVREHASQALLHRSTPTDSNKPQTPGKQGKATSKTPAAPPK